MKRNGKKSVSIILIIALIFTVLTAITVCAEENTTELEKRAADAAYSLEFPTVFSAFQNALKASLSVSVKPFFCLIAMTLICAFIHCFDFGQTLSELCGFVTVICFSGFAFTLFGTLFENVVVCMEKLRNAMLLIMPTMLCAGMGYGINTANVGALNVSLALNGAECLISLLVIPCAKLLFVLSIMKAICGKGPELSGVFGTVRSFSVWTVMLSATAVSVIMYFQTVLAKARDCISTRAIRFASASLVPLVGSALSDSLKTVSESLRALACVTGSIGIASIVTVVLPPVAAILIAKFELLLCASLAGMLGCPKESVFLYDINSVLNVINAALVMCSVCFIVLTGILMGYAG